MFLAGATFQCLGPQTPTDPKMSVRLSFRPPPPRLIGVGPGDVAGRVRGPHEGRGGHLHRRMAQGLAPRSPCHRSRPGTSLSSFN